MQERRFYHAAAVDIQRLVRGHQARRRIADTRNLGATLRLQAWWRGCRGRAKADRLWLTARVLLVQRVVRGFLVRRRYKRAHALAATAATRFQVAARGWFAKRERARHLWERESRERRDLVHMLAAEITWVERALHDIEKVCGWWVLL